MIRVNKKTHLPPALSKYTSNMSGIGKRIVPSSMEAYQVNDSIKIINFKNKNLYKYICENLSIHPSIQSSNG